MCSAFLRAPAHLGVRAAALRGGGNPFSGSGTQSLAGATAPSLPGSPGADGLPRELPEGWCVPRGGPAPPPLPQHGAGQWWGPLCPGAGGSPPMPSLRPGWAARSRKSTVQAEQTSNSTLPDRGGRKGGCGGINAAWTRRHGGVTPSPHRLSEMPRSPLREVFQCFPSPGRAEGSERPRSLQPLARPPSLAGGALAAGGCSCLLSARGWW